MKLSVGRIFLHGLAAVLPLAVTVYVLLWLGTSAERFLGALIRVVIPETYYIPGLGLAGGVVLVFGIGLLMQFVIIKRVFEWGESRLARVPLIKTLYISLRDLIGYFAGSEGREFKQVVMVAWEEPELRLLGFVARKSFEDLPEGIGSDDQVAVYLPMSYQVGGYTVYVSRSRLTPIDMPFTDAMRLILTAGVGGQAKGTHLK